MASVPGSRRAANRTSEDCYASPWVSSLGYSSTSASPSPSPRRHKRFSGSSSDSDESMGGMRVEDFRAGGPYLCTLPAMDFTVSQQHPASIKWNLQFEQGIVDRLDRHSVQWKSLTLVNRRSARYDDSGETETVVVSAVRKVLDTSWLDACLDIRNFFQLHDLSTLNIEIIDERASKEKYTFPVFEDDRIYSKWRALSMRICELIGMEGWLSLECFRRGTDPERQNNPPTVVLTIPLHAPKTWKVERDQIAALLDAEGLQEVAVEVLRSHIWRVPDANLTSGFLPDNAWEEKAQLGMSIARHASDASGSTFGGFIELLHPGTKQWSTFGLTSYRCIEPEQGGYDSSGLSTVTKGWTEQRISVNQAKAANILIDQPALKDYRERMDLIDQTRAEWMKSSLRKRVKEAMSNNEFISPKDEAHYIMSEAKVNQLRAIQSKADRFLATGNILFGKVFAGSGYRRALTPARRQLDWALIEVFTSRIGSNNVPPVGLVEDGFRVFSGQLMDQPSAKEPTHDSPMYKIGRRTDFTAGKYQALRSLHLESREADEKGNNKTVAVTEEAAVAPKYGLRFSAQGDSGSFIFDGETNFVGLLFAGHSETGVGYFTPAATLFEDIKAMTGALDVRLPLS
ncbi:hypothetical protein EMPG_16331 [Blastomyces silverae]|uniref:Uncharacterized protein n=1 Tax=Blastomyces silverae TaxID=2060906 RepID=A0A0H1BA07_9EURO|nr:hypothetical protein EMPG_16331 [Blastomyces silverae]